LTKGKGINSKRAVGAMYQFAGKIRKHNYYHIKNLDKRAMRRRTIGKIPSRGPPQKENPPHECSKQNKTRE